MMMKSLADAVDGLNELGNEYIDNDEKLKGYTLVALGGFIDGALYGCTAVGLAFTGICIGAIINKKNN